MNGRILKKCLDELSKTIPDISYIRGMLETLHEQIEPYAVTPTMVTPMVEQVSSPRAFNEPEIDIYRGVKTIGTLTE